MKHVRKLRHLALAGIVLAIFGGPAASAGCTGGFPPPSQIDGLRVLAVVADKPYAQPGDTVNFTMTYDDGMLSTNPDAGARNINVLWIGGCINPAGDEYYGCYAQLGPAFEALLSGKTPPQAVSVGFGKTFSLTLPSNLISGRPPPPKGSPSYGLAYVFFAACAGHIQPLTMLDSGGLAGSFPLECVDDQGNRLGADSFVPGYTEVFAFDPPRTNANPVVWDFTITGADDAGYSPTEAVPVCSVPDSTRNGPTGCGHTDPFQVCGNYQISVVVPHDVAEVDPGTMDANGHPQREAVWVDYYADSGNIKDPILLVSDQTLGILSSFGTTWIPPSSPGTAHLWAVVHDSRGGQTVEERTIVVE
jgi:hypothetical protein